jgi:SAM-dependent methyltransferase
MQSERQEQDDAVADVPGTAAYDAGYARCGCFWGPEPGSLVRELTQRLGMVKGWRILDAGCGEGKNAHYLWQLGADEVVAVDSSELALENARRAFPNSGVKWRQADVRNIAFGQSAYDLVIAYGLLHCLKDECEIRQVVNVLRNATRPGGWNILCAFNDRFQDLSAHPGFYPCLLSHATYASLYEDWNIEVLTDADLREVHPHNNVEHVHSMTRLIARRV